MANWKSRVNIADLSTQYRNGEITPNALGKAVAERLKKNRFSEDLAHVIEEFENAQDIEDYDCALEQLYDFADAGHRIWIESAA